MMAGNVKSRSVTPDGKEIARLRVAKGWRQEDLARKSGSSEKTIKNLELGKPCYVCTIARVAEALKVDVASLLSGQAEDFSPKPDERPPRRFEVQITLSFPFEAFDESEQLVGLIAQLGNLIGTRSAVDVVRVTNGSVKVTIELSESDVLRLMASHLDNELQGLGITSVKVPNRPGLIEVKPKKIKGVWYIARRIAWFEWHPIIWKGYRSAKEASEAIKRFGWD
jgi:transcriptional regulator with XRE-family HTH domain